MRHLLDTDLLFYCHSSKVSLIPFPAPKCWTSVSCPHNRGLTFFFCFWNLPLRLGFFSKNIQSQTSLSKLHSSHRRYAVKEFSPWTSGIQSCDVWGAHCRWLLISLPLKQLKHFVLGRCCFSQETGIGIQAWKSQFKMKWTVLGCRTMWMTNVCDEPSNCCLSPLIWCRVKGDWSLFQLTEEGQHGTGHHTAQMMNK